MNFTIEIEQEEDGRNKLNKNDNRVWGRGVKPIMFFHNRLVI
ncbi:MAG: hypothetical protein V7K32_01120 [Nostoc sp.]